MISSKDFAKKQIVFALFKNGDKLCFSNDNILIKDSEDKVKFQLTCYRLFAIFIVGNCSITSVVIANAKKYNFRIVLMNVNFKLIDVIGYKKDGNTLLKEKQYSYDGLDIAKMIIMNKISNQRQLLCDIKEKSISLKENIALFGGYIECVSLANNIYEIMAYEGTASKVFFSNYFAPFGWNGRKPRTRIDFINATLDIGYNLLFNFIDSILECFGFDTYVGVLHRQFYMRKSLVCDMVEPFRCIIDKAVRKGINLKQIKEEDFKKINNEYLIKNEYRSKYVNLLMNPILEFKDDIFIYIKYYYRYFMKGEVDKISMFLIEEK